jgi:mRNA interferase ChpB
MMRGEIWLAGLNAVPVILPINSGANVAPMTGFAVALSGAGISTTGVVRGDQPRALDFRAVAAGNWRVSPPR